MSSFIPFDRSQPYLLLPPDLKSWLPADDMAHFIVAAVERVPMSAFCVPVRTRGKAQYHPRLMLALPIFSYANGLFSSRRITEPWRLAMKDWLKTTEAGDLYRLRKQTVEQALELSKASWGSEGLACVALQKSRLNRHSLHSYIAAKEWYGFRQCKPARPRSYEPQMPNPTGCSAELGMCP
ncbi:hypothetical protein CD178_02552 [Komagataeibacter saccharivorans]|uniref:Transposase InsH N-terminal domain-containing protein n=1 Tax=Komagataeibacter saccharivorans TaxID=265959 RepID=A0A347WEK6_9PROT|nr:hypothetical protein CD178_02552 [Komagataeibacter saccharivorans]